VLVAGPCPSTYEGGRAQSLVVYTNFYFELCGGASVALILGVADADVDGSE